MGYFLDTYALIEILKGNKKYEKYLDKQSITTLFNLYQVCFLVMRDFGRERAIEIFSMFSDIVVPVEENSILLASEFRMKNNLDYLESIGYSVAMINEATYLTSNHLLKDLPNVEFVK